MKIYDKRVIFNGNHLKNGGPQHGIKYVRNPMNHKTLQQGC